MIVRVKLFAVAREIAGSNVLAVEVPEGVTIGDVRKAMVAAVPELERVVDLALLAVDAEYASDEAVVKKVSEIALIPPVSGG